MTKEKAISETESFLKVEAKSSGMDEKKLLEKVEQKLEEDNN